MYYGAVCSQCNYNLPHNVPDESCNKITKLQLLFYSLQIISGFSVQFAISINGFISSLHGSGNFLMVLLWQRSNIKSTFY